MMKVILLKGVSKLGKKDDVVEVSDGYAHNALFPKRLAIPATAQALQKLSRSRAEKEAQQAVQEELLAKSLRQLQAQAVVLYVKANKQGYLFAKVTTADIAAFLLKEHRLSIDPVALSLAEPIKETGTFTVPVSFHNFTGSFILTVKAA